MAENIAEIAEGFSDKAKARLAGQWPTAVRFLHPAHRRTFLRHQLINEGYSRSVECWAYWLTPIGEQVRAHLQKDPPK